jgi:hypothetical protein
LAGHWQGLTVAPLFWGETFRIKAGLRRLLINTSVNKLNMLQTRIGT